MISPHALSSLHFTYISSLPVAACFQFLWAKRLSLATFLSFSLTVSNLLLVLFTMAIFLLFLELPIPFICISSLMPHVSSDYTYLFHASFYSSSTILSLPLSACHLPQVGVVYPSPHRTNASACDTFYHAAGLPTAALHTDDQHWK